MATILIRGEGIAGSCCVRLLDDAGLNPSVDALRRPKLPAVMLTDTTQKLLCDVFQHDRLFAGLPQIRKRIVAWGRDSAPLVLPHSAVVVSEQELLDRIHRPHAYEERAAAVTQPDWTIFAGPLSESSSEQHFGSRRASAAAVRLKSSCDPAACWIESLENGWLFLLPGVSDRAWLLSVGAPAESHLSVSRLIAEQIREITPSQGTFPSHPRVAWPLCQPGWLACGTAAIGFDPLCGDGVGNAVREAILASAVIRAAIAGEDVESLAAHYQARLLAGFQRHLALCHEFYRSGSSGVWWDSQIEDLQRGLRWCAQQFTTKTPFRYRLNGFVLEPV